jgi:23S rRNA U2552 (ribose-2'-O)-methylase RlmE/FtsJ
MSDGFLHRWFLNNGTKRCFKFIHYFEIYERHFERFRGMRPTVLEIGVRGGGSVEMWSAYFGQGARIVGLDIDPACKEHQRDGIEVFIGSQDDPAIIDRIFETYPKLDIVIDDGSHLNHHMIASFELMYHRLSADGVYLLEDAYTVYRPHKGGGLDRDKATFMNFAKDKIDELNAPLMGGKRPVTEFSRATQSVNFYDSVIVFERRPQGHRQTLITTAMKLGARAKDQNEDADE